MNTSATLAPAQQLYTETIGTTCHLAGQSGTVTGLRSRHGAIVGAFVSLDGPVDATGRYLAPGPMLYVTLGHRTGDRGQCHDVTGWSVIDRDEFDRLNGIDTLRTDMGWRA